MQSVVDTDKLEAVQMHQLRQHQLSQDYRTIDKLIDNRDFESLKDRFKNHQKTASELKNKVDFSIDAILSPSQRPVANNSSPDQHSELKKNITDSTISWLYCTRYRPPKLPRKSYFHTSSPCYPPLIFWQSVKREINFRTRYRNPRIPFTTDEVATLEHKFHETQYLGSNDVVELAANLNMAPKRIKIWFQNRRARQRREHEVQ